MPNLSQAEKKTLKARAHALKPVVIVGNAGLTDNVVTEIDLALEHHELIKVRLNADDKKQRKEMSDKLEMDLSCDCIQIIGHVGIFYRKKIE